jgi:hypothetical protein
MPKKRKQSNLKPLKTLRIFCEGEKTEPLYINGYIDLVSVSGRKTVISIEPTRKNTPMQLVDEAVKLKKSNVSLPEDEFWVVYDREAPSKYPDALHLTAWKKAERNNVNVSLSNVCFEYWLLIHLVDTQAPYSCYDDLRKNSPLNEKMKELCGKRYEKTEGSIFQILKDKVPLARKRAKKLNAESKKSACPGRNMPFHMNPYVDVVDLLDAIDDFK